jgi:hypothetical protein
MRGLVAHLLPMMLDDASGRGAENGMVTSHMARHCAHRSSLNTAFGVRARRH